MSDKSVAERLQVKPGRRLAVIGAPAPLERVVGAQDSRASPEAAEVVLLFAPDRAAFEAGLDAWLPKLGRDAIFWVAYPKLTSPLAADLSRDIIHRAAPGWRRTTVSQIAVDDDWSALRLKRLD